MSWYRQIKILYTISSNTFFFIIFGSILNGVLPVKVHYGLFLLSLFTAYFMAYILERTNKLIISAAATIIISEAVLFLIYGKANIIIHSIYICFILYITYIDELQDVNYEVYKYKAKQAIVTLVILGFVFTIAKLNTQQTLLKFYIIFLISTSILMREARNYYYSLKNSKSFITNITITVGIIFISLDSVFNVILICLKFIGTLFYKIAEEVSRLISIEIDKPLEIIINYLRKKFSNNPNVINRINVTQYKPQLNNDDTTNIASNTGLPTWLTGTIKVIILLMIIYFAYRLFYKYKGKVRRNSKEVLVEREKLSKEKKHNDNFIKKAVKNILKLSDLREQAINVYKKFELKTNEKGIFRKYMTARQLENITKAYIENPEGINNLTDTYNEAKFSTHKITKENVETMKGSLTKVKKQL